MKLLVDMSTMDRYVTFGNFIHSCVVHYYKVALGQIRGGKDLCEHINSTGIPDDIGLITACVDKGDYGINVTLILMKIDAIKRIIYSQNMRMIYLVNFDSDFYHCFQVKILEDLNDLFTVKSTTLTKIQHVLPFDLFTIDDVTSLDKKDVMLYFTNFYDRNINQNWPLVP